MRLGQCGVQTACEQGRSGAQTRQDAHLARAEALEARHHSALDAHFGIQILCDQTHRVIFRELHSTAAHQDSRHVQRQLTLRKPSTP